MLVEGTQARGSEAIGFARINYQGRYWKRGKGDKNIIERRTK
jgi:hypothetical protein